MKSLLLFFILSSLYPIPGFTQEELNGPLAIIREKGESFLVYPEGPEEKLSIFVLNALPYSEGFIPVQIRASGSDGVRWGYLNNDGSVAFQSEANFAGPFKEGMAWLMFLDSLGGQYFQYVNPAGETVISKEFAEAGNFSEGLAYVADINWTGYIDQSGDIKLLLPEGWMGGEEFKGNIAVVQDQNFNKGVIDNQGKILLDPEYTEIYINTQGPLLAVEFYDTYIYDRTGELILPLDGVNALGPYVDGLAPAEKGESVGFVDEEGNWAIPPQFEDARSFSQGLAAVKLEGQWGFIDLQGNPVIETKYTAVGNFRNGLAYFFDGDNDQGGYLDSDGNIYLVLEWDVLFDLTSQK